MDNPNFTINCFIVFIIRSDIRSIITALLHISVAEVNATVSERDLRTAAHLASAMGNLCFIQLLVWNNADVTKTDHEGRTCLSYAKAALSLASQSPNDSENQSQSGITSLDTTKELVEMLINLGCVDSPLPMSSTGTIQRRRDMLRPRVFEKLPSSVI